MCIRDRLGELPEILLRTVVYRAVDLGTVSYTHLFLVPWRTGRFRTVNQPKTKVELSINFQDRPYYARTLSSAGITYMLSLIHISRIARAVVSGSSRNPMWPLFSSHTTRACGCSFTIFSAASTGM